MAIKWTDRDSAIKHGFENGKAVIEGQLFADAVSDLPALHGEVGGALVEWGSIAYVAGDQYYTMKSSGTWVGQDGAEV